MAPNRKRRSYIRRFRDSSLFFIFLVIERQSTLLVIALELGLVGLVACLLAQRGRGLRGNQWNPGAYIFANSELERIFLTFYFCPTFLKVFSNFF